MSAALVVLAAALSAEPAGAGIRDVLCPAPGAERFVALGSTLEDRLRLAQLTEAAPLSSQLFRRGTREREPLECGAPAEGTAPGEQSDGSFVAPLPVTLATYFNSTFPDERNDGALWTGRGVTTGLTGGVRAKWRWFSASVEPLVGFQENKYFPLEWTPLQGRRSFAYQPAEAIDLPLRPRTGPFFTFHPGQSYVRVDAFNAAVGFSTENLWWGPGQRSSILMTNTAPGFPHVFAGTSKPVDVHLGWLEAQVIWGHLYESPVFDENPTNDTRLLTALTLGFRPKGWPGLSFGAARVFLYRSPPEGLSPAVYFTPLFGAFLKEAFATPENPGGQSDDNQLFSVFARWAIPEVRSELYFELARDDHNWDFVDLAMEPDHSLAYLFGGQKVFAVGGNLLRILFEAVHVFERPVVPFWRATPAFYTHYAVLQGYTHRGQMLGAAVGPGGDEQILSADLFTQGSRFGLYLRRTLRNELYYFEHIATPGEHDLELRGGLRFSTVRGPFSVDVDTSISHRWNRDFGPDELNWSAFLSLSYQP